MSKIVNSPAQSLFSDVRVIIMNKDSLRGLASCKVGDAIYLSGMRVVEGSHGKFVAMPARKTPAGEYKDLFFPASREVREMLQQAILAKYEEATAQTAA